MAKNFVQAGDLVTVIALAACVSGELVKVGNIAGVALNDAATGEEVTLKLTGVWHLKKTSAQAWAVGDQIYRLSNGSCANASATGAQLIGVATEVAANPSATGAVRLNGVSLPAAAA